MDIALQISRNLLKIFPFTAEHVQLFLERSVIRSLRKNDFLLAPPQVCRFTGIVLQGSFRLFKRSEDREHTLHFFTEEHWIADLESFVAQQPTVNHIQAMEKAEVALISIEDIHHLIVRENAFLALGRIMKEWALPTGHYTSLIDDKPDTRYQALLDAHPDWILRFPQMYLAAYLGMSRETFSRVKRRNLSIS